MLIPFSDKENAEETLPVLGLALKEPGNFHHVGNPYNYPERKPSHPQPFQPLQLKYWICTCQPQLKSQLNAALRVTPDKKKNHLAESSQQTMKYNKYCFKVKHLKMPLQFKLVYHEAKDNQLTEFKPEC